MTIGGRIKKLRMEKGLTQSQLASALNVSTVVVARWESETRELKTGSIIALAEYFGVTTDYLLGITSHSTLINTNIGKTTGLSDSNINKLMLFFNDEHFEGQQFMPIINSVLECLLNDQVLHFLLNGDYAKTRIKNLACEDDVEIITQKIILIQVLISAKRKIETNLFDSISNIFFNIDSDKSLDELLGELYKKREILQREEWEQIKKISKYINPDE